MKNFLKKCLDSLRGQTYPLDEIIVIDNSTNGDFSQQIINDYPEIKICSSGKNLFYCEALNKGIELTKGDYILCLNDDVILDKRFIEEALKGFGLECRIGMVSGKILRLDKETIDSTGLFLSIWRTAKERGYGIKDRGRYAKGEYIFGIGGAVAFYRRQMLEDIEIESEYFDLDFRIFYDDLDIAWRARLFGWKAYYIPEAVAYHLRGGTVRQGKGINKPFARRYLNEELYLDLVKNRYLAIIKNESIFAFLLHLPFVLLYDFFAYIDILFFRPRIFKRWWLNLKYLKSAWKKRRAIRERIRRC